MAKEIKRKVEEESEEEEEEEAYEVEEITKHKRKKDGTLQYYITWKGYPSADGHDTWEGEESADGCNEILEAYWKGVDPSKRHERYAPGSKEAKAALAKASNGTASSSKKRSADAADSSNSSRRAGGRSVVAEKEVKNGNKRAKKEISAELESPARKPVVAKGKKAAAAVAIKDEEEEETGETEAVDDAEDGYSTDGKVHNTHEIELADEESWEDYISKIDTIERDDEGELKLFVVWEEDDSYSWIKSDVARKKCPQKVIDFYEGHLKFKVKSHSEEE